MLTDWLRDSVYNLRRSKGIWKLWAPIVAELYLLVEKTTYVTLTNEDHREALRSVRKHLNELEKGLTTKPTVKKTFEHAAKKKRPDWSMLEEATQRKYVRAVVDLVMEDFESADFPVEVGYRGRNFEVNLSRGFVGGTDVPEGLGFEIFVEDHYYVYQDGVVRDQVFTG